MAVVSIIIAVVACGLCSLGWRRERSLRRDAEFSEIAHHNDFKAVLQSLGSGLLLVDQRGTIRTVSRSACHMIGLEREALVGASVNEVFPTGWHEFTRCIVQVLMHEESVEREEVQITKPDGERIPVGMTVNPFYGTGGEQHGAVAVFQDLSEVTRLRERMREADRLAAIGELAASIAHEIRNPLGSIRGSTEILNGELSLDRTQQRLFDLILKESGRVNSLIQDFLEYARIRPIQPRPVQIAEYFEDIVLQTRVHCGPTAESLQLVSRVDPPGLVLLLDEDQMRQVLLNLTLNAAQWVGPKGRIRLEAELQQEQGTCAIIVSDNGPGIKPEILDSLFQPFVTGRAEGNGLGLPTVQRIVCAHEGSVTATNREEGGAEFRIVLPLFGAERPTHVDAQLSTSAIPCLID